MLFVVCCLGFVVRCLGFVVRCSLFVVRCLGFVVRCLLFVVCCSLFVVRCLGFVVWGLSFRLAQVRMINIIAFAERNLCIVAVNARTACKEQMFHRIMPVGSQHLKNPKTLLWIIIWIINAVPYSSLSYKIYHLIESLLLKAHSLLPFLQGSSSKT